MQLHSSYTLLTKTHFYKNSVSVSLFFLLILVGAGCCYWRCILLSFINVSLPWKMSPALLFFSSHSICYKKQWMRLFSLSLCIDWLRSLEENFARKFTSWISFLASHVFLCLVYQQAYLITFLTKNMHNLKYELLHIPHPHATYFGVDNYRVGFSLCRLPVW